MFAAVSLLGEYRESVLGLGINMENEKLVCFGSELPLFRDILRRLILIAVALVHLDRRGHAPIKIDSFRAAITRDI